MLYFAAPWELTQQQTSLDNFDQVFHKTEGGEYFPKTSNIS